MPYYVQPPSKFLHFTLLYGQLPPVIQMKKKLEAAPMSSSQVPTIRLLGITRKDKMRNEEIRKKTGLWKLQLIIKKKTEVAGTRIKNGGLQKTSLYSGN